ncbi:V-type proton ATPase subunit E [subsurface metagenome]
MTDTKIRAKILSDAKTEADKILQEAKFRADEILKQATNRAGEIEKETGVIAKDAKRKELERRLSEARMQNRKKLLQEKRRIIDSVFDEAKKRLLSLKKSEYISFIANIIKKEVKGDNFVFILAKGDVNRFGKGVFKEILEKLHFKETIPFEKGDFDGGCILKKDKYEFNATIDTILGRIKERLESELAKTLFA